MESFQDTDKARYAFLLSQNKQVYLDRFQQLSDNQDTQQIIKEARNLIQRISKNDLYPKLPPALESRKPSWLLNEGPEQGFVVAKKCEHIKGFYWVVIYPSGQIYRAPASNDGIGYFYEDDESLTKEIRAIIESFIDRLA